MLKKENYALSTLVPNSLKLSTDRQRRIKEVSDHGIAAIGQALLIKSFQDKRLSASQAIKAKCYDCMGFFEDGKADCGDPLCPLYPWMPYSQKKAPSACANRALPGKKSDAPDRLYSPNAGNSQDEDLP